MTQDSAPEDRSGGDADLDSVLEYDARWGAAGGTGVVEPDLAAFVDEHPPDEATLLALLMVEFEHRKRLAGPGAPEATFLVVPREVGKRWPRVVTHAVADFRQTARMPIRRGTTFSRYRIERRIGWGGSGAVFEVSHPRFGPRALKIPRRRVTARYTEEKARRARERLFQEARILDVLSRRDAAFPQAHDAGFEQGVPFIVIEYIRGRTLADLRDSLDLGTIARFGGETARSLGVAHDAGIAHRDITPYNLILDADSGRVKIVDFGNAIELGGGRDPEPRASLRTTSGFVAPEVLRRWPWTQACEVYALAASLVYLITGEAPGMARSKNKLFDSHVNILLIREWISHPLRVYNDAGNKLVDELCELLGACISREPSERIGSLSELGDKLLDWSRRFQEVEWDSRSLFNLLKLRLPVLHDIDIPDPVIDLAIDLHSWLPTPYIERVPIDRAISTAGWLARTVAETDAAKPPDVSTAVEMLFDSIRSYYGVGSDVLADEVAMRGLASVWLDRPAAGGGTRRDIRRVKELVEIPPPDDGIWFGRPDRVEPRYLRSGADQWAWRKARQLEAQAEHERLILSMVSDYGLTIGDTLYIVRALKRHRRIGIDRTHPLSIYSYYLLIFGGGSQFDSLLSNLCDLLFNRKYIVGTRADSIDPSWMRRGFTEFRNHFIAQFTCSRLDQIAHLIWHEYRPSDWRADFLPPMTVFNLGYLDDISLPDLIKGKQMEDRRGWKATLSRPEGSHAAPAERTVLEGLNWEKFPRIAGSTFTKEALGPPHESVPGMATLTIEGPNRHARIVRLPCIVLPKGN